MPDKFPEKNKGDSLSHQHVNALGEAFRQTNLPGSGFPPWQQFAFTVASDEGSGIYKGTIRYFNHGTAVWLDKTREWDLDANISESTLTVGDKVPAYWDGQRGMFVPVVCLTTSCGCVFGGDRFNRADTGGPGFPTGTPGDLGDKWEQTTGIWWINGASGGWPSPTLGISDAGICKYVDSYPEATDTPIAYRVFGNMGTNLGTWRLLTDYVDTNNYLAVEVRVSSWVDPPDGAVPVGSGTKITIISRVAGVETELASTEMTGISVLPSTGQWLPLMVCYETDLNKVFATLSLAIPIPPLGTRERINVSADYTRTVNTAAIQVFALGGVFDEFAILNYANDPGGLTSHIPGCYQCGDRILQFKNAGAADKCYFGLEEWLVEIEGFPDSGFYDESEPCADLNKPYKLCATSLGIFGWQHITGATGTGQLTIVRMPQELGTVVKVQLIGIAIATTQVLYEFSEALGDIVRDFSHHELPLTFTHAINGCDMTNVKCFITQKPDT